MTDEHRESDGPRLRRPSILFASLVAGTLLFLATKNPTVSAVVPALIAGWGSVNSGLWLQRTDPDRARAWICFAFQIAAGCWQAAAAAFASLFISMVTAHLTRRGPNMQAFAATMLILTAGVALNTLFGLVAVGAALRYRLRVWVHPKLQKTLDEETQLADGEDLHQFRFNYAIFVVGTALVFPVLTLGCVAVILTSVNAAPANQVATMSVVVMLLAFVVAPLAMIPCYVWLSSRVVARSPRECWPHADK